MSSITPENILFSTDDIFGVRVRTTKSYFQKIISLKHTELEVAIDEIVFTLQKPDEVWMSVQDGTIKLYHRKRDNNRTLVIVVKYLTIDEGFLVTMYETSNPHRKGKKVWPKTK